MIAAFVVKFPRPTRIVAVIHSLFYPHFGMTLLAQPRKTTGWVFLLYYDAWELWGD